MHLGTVKLYDSVELIRVTVIDNNMDDFDTDSFWQMADQALAESGEEEVQMKIGENYILVRRS